MSILLFTVAPAMGQVFDLTAPASRVVFQNNGITPNDIVVTLQGNNDNSLCHLYLDGNRVKGEPQSGKGQATVPLTVKPNESLTSSVEAGTAGPQRVSNPTCRVTVAPAGP